MDSSSNFVHIPRTGGHTMFDALGGPPDACHIKAKYMPGKFLFAVVRNPYDRAVALWEFKKFDLSFSEWAKTRLENTDWWYYDTPHQFRFADPMHTFLNAPVKHVLRFENLSEEFNNMCVAEGEQNNLKWDEAVQDYKQYYDEETRKIVGTKYREDLTKYNYKF